MTASEARREHVDQRHCPKCDTWHTIAAAEENYDPTACPKCGWRPGGTSEAEYPDA
jgi:Zn ribbon nucleic-acid-binding protein